MFVITCMPVGGAETLLVNLVRRLDRHRVAPELCCLKYLGPLGEMLAEEVPTFSGLLAQKYDLRVLPRLTRLIRRRRIDAVITVGTGGDKMFWGRLAAYLAGVPVIASALHSTGLPDHVEFLNRLLAPVTDAFIAVAETHGRYLVDHEGCPAERVRVVPNGVDTERFHPRWRDPRLAAEIGLPQDAPTVGIVAALRPEKNHELFLETARLVQCRQPRTHWLVIGDGPRRARLEQMAEAMGLGDRVLFLGSRNDVPRLLSLLDVHLLTSHMEANPVSILEAMASEIPVVATDVGSVHETVLDGQTGYLAPAGDAPGLARRLLRLLEDPSLAAALGRAGREHVLTNWSLARMVDGYTETIEEIYRGKAARRPVAAHPPAEPAVRS